MADASESFNVEAVKSQMSTLEGYFNVLSEKLSEINKTVNEEINVGPESAVFGQLGSKLLGTWNANASTFGDFHANFESWSQIVAIIAANNTAFDAETINLYKDNGSTLTYATDDGTRLTISSLRESKANEQAFNYLSSKYSDSKDYETSIEDNVLKVKDKDGNVVVEYTVDNGKLKNTKTYDEDGNYSLIMYGVDEDGNKTVKVKYYDKDGKELKEKPSTFNEDGTLKTKTIFNKISEDIANKGKEIRDSFVDGANELMDTCKEKFDDLSKKNKDYENRDKDGDTSSEGTTGSTSAEEETQTQEDPSQGESSSQGDTLSEGTTGSTSAEEETKEKSSVVVQSGQKVRINGEDVYFVCSDSENKYYTKNDEPGAKLYVLENGKLVEKTSGGYFTRKDLVNNYKNNLEVSWKEEYNNGTSPYDNVYDTVESSFVDGVNKNNLNSTNISYSREYLENESVKISELKSNLDLYKQGDVELPNVIKLCKGQQISVNRAWWDNENVISGNKDQDAVYLVRNSENNGYYLLDDDACYNPSVDKYDGEFISDKELLDQDTNIG